MIIKIAFLEFDYPMLPVSRETSEVTSRDHGLKYMAAHRSCFYD